MSAKQDKSFWDEIQGRYTFKINGYTPPFNVGAGLTIYADLNDKEMRPNCPYCNSRPNIHEYHPKTLTFGTLNGTPVHFEMNHCRYLCKSCNSTFMEEFEHLLWHTGLTTDAQNHILAQIGSRTFTDIAYELGLCTQTVANVATSFGEAERVQRLSTPYRFLSMDEVFISRDADGKSVYYWVLNDISTPWKSNNIRVDLGRSKEDVVKRLKELSHPNRVEAVCIDMWIPYRDAIHEVFPWALVVVDPFHVIQLAQKKMDEVRKGLKLGKKMTAEMKKDACLLSKSLFKLSGDELDRIETYLQADSKLEKAYFIIQELMSFYRIGDYESALDYLASWESDVLESGVEEMISVLHTVQNWLPYILNHFIFRISNGKTEGKNHKIRVIHSMGYHYNVDALQACLYAHDRKQEFHKWLKHQRKLFKRLQSDTTRPAA